MVLHSFQRCVIVKMGQKFTSQRKMERYTAFGTCGDCEQPFETAVMIPEMNIASIKCPECKCSNKPDILSNGGLIKIYVNKSCMNESNVKKKTFPSSKKEKYTAICICGDCEQPFEKPVMIPKMKIVSIKCLECKCSSKPSMLSNGGSLRIHVEINHNFRKF